MRFYLDLTDGLTIIRDESGVEASSLRGFVRHTRSTMREMGRSGDLDTGSTRWWMIVRDAEGNIRRMIAVDSSVSSCAR